MIAPVTADRFREWQVPRPRSSSHVTELPNDVVAEVERLTLLARRAADPAEADAYRADRDGRLAEFGFESRVREEDGRDVLVCYPTDWMEDGVVQLERIEDRSPAVEIPLGGVGDEDEWEAVEAANREVVEGVEERAGPVHAANARAFADFMGNHYVRRMGSAGEQEVSEFLTEYFPRNAWPSDEQREVVEESLRLVFEVGDAEAPPALEQR